MVLLQILQVHFYSSFGAERYQRFHARGLFSVCRFFAVYCEILAYVQLPFYLSPKGNQIE